MNTPQSMLHVIAGTSLLIAFFLLLRPLLRRIVGSEWLCVLWLALLARLLMPWPLESRWSLANRLPGYAAPAGISYGPWKIHASVTGGDLKDKRVEILTNPEPAKPGTPGTGWNLFIITWLAGFALNALVLIWRWHQTRVLASTTRPADDARLLKIFAEIPVPWRRGVELRMTDALHVPTLAGVLRPQIWIPQSWPAQFTDGELRNVLLHELGHARRRDLAVQWLFAIAQGLHWFNPLVWFANRAARLDREMACDAWVLTRCGTDHSDYGATLMKTVQLLRAPLRISPAAVAMASGRRSLYARVSGIGAFRQIPAWRGIISITIMLAALATSTTKPVVAQETPAPAISPVAPAVPDEKVPPNSAGARIDIQARFIQLSESAWEKFKDPAAKLPDLPVKNPLDGLAGEESDLKDGAWETTGNLGFLGSFTTEQVEEKLKSYSKSKEIDLLSAPSVSIIENHNAKIGVVREFNYPMRYEQPKELQGGYMPVEFSKREVGVNLEVTAEVKNNGAISLHLIPECVEFLGFVKVDGGKKVFSKPDVKRPVQPLFSTLRTETTLAVPDGGTILLGGRMFAGERQVAGGKNPERRVLLIFITPKVVDAAWQPSPTPAAASPTPESDSKIPRGVPIEGKEGFVTSPHSPDAGAVDVRGFPKGTKVKDPYSGKIFLVP